VQIDVQIRVKADRREGEGTLRRVEGEKRIRCLRQFPEQRPQEGKLVYRGGGAVISLSVKHRGGGENPLVKPKRNENCLFSSGR